MLTFPVMIAWLIVGFVASAWVHDHVEPWHRLRAQTMLAMVLVVCIIVSELAMYTALD